MNKPFSQACENNKAPILQVLKRTFSDVSQVLEVGSGTGQHAVYMAEHLPHLQWQPSDQLINLPGVKLWCDEYSGDNLLPPIELDVTQAQWPEIKPDGIFTANTLHIMSWAMVEAFFKGIGSRLQAGGKLCIYGPFNYQGTYTSESNQAFDRFLRDRDPLSGIREFEAVVELAELAGLALVADHRMPANNRLLEWCRIDV
ncbi:DUF938 domain-containing protein [Oceanospirillum linum]|uniref:Methylase n=1 Tax=Oceanospirillum linum TaxID=966 RepID=A0A1T1HF55_OCELI|nr:DUF938 domain-containing protein [Oceanospirillum linum]OOV88337.1 methylase [Oceanospirillum linum]SEF52729.1 Protein of unknown function [Oleiphilus messinensis]SMP04498.1 Protein of unknown function [Oceanospirillum linum]